MVTRTTVGRAHWTHRALPAHARPVVALPVLEVVMTVRGHVVRGRFSPVTRELRVLTRPWAGRTFRTPAEAAAELARYFAAGRAPRAGELPRWRLVATGGVLRASASRGAVARPAATSA